jgi:hypothetical protein
LALNGSAIRTALIPVGTEHATVAAFGFQEGLTAFADIKIQAGVDRDFLERAMVADGTGNGRQQRDAGHALMMHHSSAACR